MIKALKLSIAIWMISLILVGCNPVGSTQELTGNPPTINAPTVNAPTLALTPTTAPTPTIAPTLVPPPEITSENAAQLKKYSEYSFYSPNDGSWSPDQKWLAIAASNGLVLYDGTTYEQVKQLSTDCISKIAWAPDSKNIAAIRCDGRLAIWDSENDQVILTTKEKFLTFIRGFKYSHSGEKIAAYGTYGQLMIWDAKTGNLIASTEYDQTIEIYSFCFTQDDGRILYYERAVVGETVFGAIKSWDLKRRSYIILEDKNLNQGVFSSDCTFYLSLDDKNGIGKILQIETKKFVKTLFGLGNDAAFIDNDKIVSISGNQMKVLDITGGKTPDVLNVQNSGRNDQVKIIAISPNRNSIIVTLASADMNGFPEKAQVISIEDGKIQAEFFREAGTFFFSDLIISPDSTLLALPSNGGILTLIKIPSLEKQKEFVLSGKILNFVDSAFFSEDGNYLLAGSEETKEMLNWIKIKNWAVEKSTKLNNPIHNMQLSPDGKMLAWNTYSWGSDNFQLVEVDTGNLIKISPKIEPYWQIGWIDWPTFSPENKNIAFIFNTMSNDPPPTRKAVIWDLDKNKEVARFTSEGAYQISYSPDGKYLIFRNGANIQIIDTNSSRIYRSIITNSDATRSISFDVSPNNQLIAYSIWNEPVTIVDLKTGKEIVTLDTIIGPDVKFTRDGQYLIISGQIMNPTISVWSVQQ